MINSYTISIFDLNRNLLLPWIKTNQRKFREKSVDSGIVETCDELDLFWFAVAKIRALYPIVSNLPPLAFTSSQVCKTPLKFWYLDFPCIKASRPLWAASDFKPSDLMISLAKWSAAPPGNKKWGIKFKFIGHNRFTKIYITNYYKWNFLKTLIFKVLCLMPNLIRKSWMASIAEWVMCLLNRRRCAWAEL